MHKTFVVEHSTHCVHLNGRRDLSGYPLVEGIDRDPRMKTESGGKSFGVTAANAYNKIPVIAKQPRSRVLCRNCTDTLMEVYVMMVFS